MESQQRPVNPYLQVSSSIFLQDLKEFGIIGFIQRRMQRRFVDHFIQMIRRMQKPVFVFQGTQYQYCIHPYNYTWKNERAVEVAIFRDILEKNSTKEILEVGNVLSHYVTTNHDILDKYEIAPGIINTDVVSYRPTKKYDLILSVSTLEHVGWHEIPYEKNKILKAIRNLRSILRPKGKVIFSVPLGINKDLDFLIQKNTLPITKRYFMKRVTGLTNHWVQTTWKDVQNCDYNTPFPNANAIMIGVLEK